MNGLTLWQPWASLLVHGIKRIETRHWYTGYRGPLIITAAKRFAYDEREFCKINWVLDDLQSIGIDNPLTQMPLGVALGMGDLVACVRMIGPDVNFGKLGKYVVSTKDLEYGDWTPGRYGWVFDNMVHFKKPVPFKGGQAIWRAPFMAGLDLMSEERGGMWTISGEHDW